MAIPIKEKIEELANKMNQVRKQPKNTELIKEVQAEFKKLNLYLSGVNGRYESDQNELRVIGLKREDSNNINTQTGPKKNPDGTDGLWLKAIAEREKIINDRLPKYLEILNIIDGKSEYLSTVKQYMSEIKEIVEQEKKKNEFAYIHISKDDFNKATNPESMLPEDYLKTVEEEITDSEPDFKYESVEDKEKSKSEKSLVKQNKEQRMFKKIAEKINKFAKKIKNSFKQDKSFDKVIDSNVVKFPQTIKLDNSFSKIEENAKKENAKKQSAKKENKKALGRA